MSNGCHRRTVGRAKDQCGLEEVRLNPGSLFHDSGVNHPLATGLHLGQHRADSDAGACFGIDRDRPQEVHVTDLNPGKFRVAKQVKCSLGHGFQPENRGEKIGSLEMMVPQVGIGLKGQMRRKNHFHPWGQMGSKVQESPSLGHIG